MSTVYYDTAFICIDSQATNEAKLAKIEAIITALEDTVLKSVGTGNISEYSLNDGQTVIRTVYRDVQSVIKDLQSLEMIRQRYINRINGHIVRLVDGKSFNNYRNGNR